MRPVVRTKTAVWAAVVLVAVALMATLTPYPSGPGNFWIAALARAGLLPADVLTFPGFDDLQRRRSGNDALACPAGGCARQNAEFEVPVFEMPANELLARIHQAALAEPRTVRSDIAPQQDFRIDFRQTSAIFRFPDIISVEVFALGPQRSTFAIWSRSVVGLSDFGVNRARVARWLAAISASAS